MRQGARRIDQSLQFRRPGMRALLALAVSALTSGLAAVGLTGIATTATSVRQAPK